MSNKKYWQNFGDLNQSDRFQEAAQKEFQEELLPLEELDGKGLLDAKTPRRDFLKYVGFSTAAAALAAFARAIELIRAWGQTCPCATGRRT